MTAPTDWTTILVSGLIALIGAMIGAAAVVWSTKRSRADALSDDAVARSEAMEVERRSALLALYSEYRHIWKMRGRTTVGGFNLPMPQDAYRNAQAHIGTIDLARRERLYEAAYHIATYNAVSTNMNTRSANQPSLYTPNADLLTRTLGESALDHVGNALNDLEEVLGLAREPL